MDKENNMPEIDPNKTLANDYHVFTNNSDLLKQLNMQTFTTGTLFEFWHTKDENDVNYKFRKLLRIFGSKIDWKI